MPIIKRSKYVVVDGSALQLNEDVSDEIKLDFAKEISKNIWRKRIYTVPDVYQETRTGSAPFELSQIQLRVKINKKDRRVYERNFSALFNWIRPKAEKRGVVDRNKMFPFADVKLAALAFCLSHEPGEVSFLSADRRLNNLVYDIREEVKTSYPRDFPCLIEGNLKVYSLIRSKAIFVPHEILRPTLNY